MAWIWMVGCMAWLFDGLLRAHLRDWTHAELAFLVAAMFAGAWFFYSRQPNR